MDKIFLNDLKIDAIIGIYDWERKTSQTLNFDIELNFDICKAAASDNIVDSIDYDAIARTTVNFVESSRYQIIEALAENVCALLLEKFPIPRIKLTLSKPITLHGQNTAKISIERNRVDHTKVSTNE